MKRTVRIAMPLAAAVLSLVLLTQVASASIYPTFTTSLTQGQIDNELGGEGGGTRHALNFANVTPDTRLGSHADFTTRFGFGFGGVLSPQGVERPGTYADGSDWRETVKGITVDLPPGLVGNPNAVPYEERCDEADFIAADGTDEHPGCPESATVGELWLKVSILTGDETSSSALSIVPFGPERRATYDSPSSGYTRVSLLKTPSEVPARIGIFVLGPVSIGRVKTILEIEPVVDEDLHLRARTVLDIPDTVTNYNYDPPETQNIRIEMMLVKFFGHLPNGHDFMTSPTSCQPWTSVAQVQPWRGAPGSDNPPVVADPSTITPDCSNAASLPFPARAQAAYFNFRSPSRFI